VAKKALIIALTAASLLCIVDPLSRLGATDQNWLPMEREFLIASSTGLVLATVLLWARVRLALVPAVVAHLVFGSYLAWLIIGTIRSENYSGPVVLVFLVCMGLCPFLAAFAAAIFLNGGDICRDHALLRTHRFPPLPTQCGVQVACRQ